MKFRTGLPYTEAKALAKRVVDYTLLASFTIKPYGKKEKRFALKNVDLKKFIARKGKDPKVREFVEKNKFRLDKKTETDAITQTRLRKITIDRIQELKKELSKQQKQK